MCIRDRDRTLQSPDAAALGAQVPEKLRELWTATTDSDDLVVDQGGVVLTEGTKATMVRGQDGSEVWHYRAPNYLCAVAANWGNKPVPARPQGVRAGGGAG